MSAKPWSAAAISRIVTLSRSGKILPFMIAGRASALPASSADTNRPIQRRNSKSVSAEIFSLVQIPSFMILLGTIFTCLLECFSKHLSLANLQLRVRLVWSRIKLNHAVCRKLQRITSASSHSRKPRPFLADMFDALPKLGDKGMVSRPLWPTGKETQALSAGPWSAASISRFYDLASQEEVPPSATAGDHPSAVVI